MGNHKDPWPPGYEVRIKELFACDEELNMTDWAQLLGCELKAVYNYRDCVSLPNAWKIYLLCKYAGCTSDWLLFGTGPKPDWFKKERVRRVQ